ARDRAGTCVLLGRIRVLALPELVPADRRLRDPVPAAGSRRRAGRVRAGDAEPRGGGPLARPEALRRLAASDAAADRPGARCGVRARVHLDGDRADRDAAAAPDRREHAGDPVLGVYEQLLIWRRGALRWADGGDLRGARVPAQPTHVGACKD